MESSIDRVVHKYFLPSEFYDHDTGWYLYLIMLPVESSYMVSQAIKNGYYHMLRLNHSHE